MSPGAAWMAVCCWLLEELPPLLSVAGPRTYTKITGFGKSRPMWKESDNQAFIMSMLKDHGNSAGQSGQDADQAEDARLVAILQPGERARAQLFLVSR